MGCSKFVNVVSAEAQLVKEILRLIQENALLEQLMTTNEALDAITEPILLMWNEFYTQRNTVLLKQQSFYQLATWWLRRLQPNRRNDLVSGIPRLVALYKKCTATLLAVEIFYIKWSLAERETTRMGIVNFSKTMEIDLKNATIEDLEAEVGKLEERIPKATEMKNKFISLKEEWNTLKETVDTELDDCIYKMNALIQEV